MIALTIYLVVAVGVAAHSTYTLVDDAGPIARTLLPWLFALAWPVVFAFAAVKVITGQATYTRRDG